ncbi:MAG: PD40 domain-containing protein [Chloroflexi bacterium]|nr:PD40 domain-containing protein [Chloroflexota bacterium]
MGTVLRDGSGRRTIAAPGAGRGGVRAPLGYTWPTWSPDGRQVAVSRIPGPERGDIASLVVLDADGSNERFVHVTNDGQVNFVADGAPHYTHWSPDGRRLSFVAPRADGTRLGLFETAVADADPYLVAENAPLYHTWSPDSSGILLHRREQLLVHSVAGRSTQAIGRNSGSYRVPAYSRRGAWMAYAADIGAGEQLIAWSLETGAERELWPLEGEVAFAWSPREDVLAATQRVDAFSAGTDGLVLIDAATGERRRIFDGSVLSFFWSPDGSRIAIASPGPGGGSLEWLIVAVDPGTKTRLTPFVPASDYLTFLQFFDQYAPSHLVWSADSRYLVFAGTIPGDDSRSRAWVVDVTGAEEPRSVADGRLAFWVPPLAP